MTDLLSLPNLSAPLVDGGNRITEVWRRVFQSVVNSANAVSGVAQPPQTVVLTSSPFSYTATANGFLVISGGGVAALAMKRGVANFIAMGRFYGPFPMLVGDIMRITYPATAPTVVFFPG